MVFSSLVFICIFLPVVLILHTAIPNRKAQNGLLLAASLLFYAYGEPVYILLMLASTLSNYLLTLWMAKKPSKWMLGLIVGVNIGLLGIFKYAGFFMQSLNSLLGTSLPVPHISLPIGISFFTFQALSYVIDVYRGQVQPQRNFGKLLLYISFFPQLIAGPIVRYIDVAKEIDQRTTSLDKMAFGLRRFIGGLGKKVLISNAMGAVADQMFGAGALHLDALGAWIGAIAYALQIYFDFSGYSDMAIGMGSMFGFHFKENFRYPYTAVSIRDFWRRWHISLSSCFRDYVYIPLGGNRKGKTRTVINRLIVFFLTGLWHGANWTFVVWGLFHGFFLLLEEFVPRLQRLPKVLGHLYTLVTVVVGFVIFRAETITQAWQYICKMFGGFTMTTASLSLTVQTLSPWFLCMLLAGVLCAGPLGKITDRVRQLQCNQTLSRKESLVQNLTFCFAALLLGWCILRLAGGGYNPFIYFRF